MKRFFVFWALLSLGSYSGSESPPPEVSSPDPLPVRSSTTSSDGVEISFARRGDGETALVFIHGWCCDSTFWESQVDVFAEDFTVVTVDLAGHGESGQNREDWTLSSLGYDVQAVVVEAGLQRVILVGHSMGGAVALYVAQLMPQKVIGVVGVDTLADVEFKWDPGRIKQIVERYRDDFVSTCRVFVKAMLTDQSEQSLVESVTNKMCDAPPEIAIPLLEDTSLYDMKAGFEAVQVPVRCINADRFPTRVEINRKYSKDYDAIIMEDIGHFPMMERPDEFNRHLKTVLDELQPR